MNKKYIEKLFLEEQFDNVLDILLENNKINEEQYDYYMKLYYNDEDYKEDFIENILDKECD